MKNTYKKRIIDKLIKENLEIMGALQIAGPRFCGKTTTASHFVKSIFYLNGYSMGKLNSDNAKENPQIVLDGDKPRLIDEWQEFPKIWDLVRHYVDIKNKYGQFILTGSVVENRETISHSGIGRFIKINMTTCTLYEKGFSSGQISLENFVKEPDKFSYLENKSNTTYEDILTHTILGGWPIFDEKEYNLLLKKTKNYLNGFFELDKNYLEKNKFNIESYKKLLLTLARLEGQEIKITKIKEEVYGQTRANYDVRTIERYLNFLEDLYIIKRQRYFNPNALSSLRTKKSDIIRFIDPSIPINLLNLDKKQLLNNPNFYGTFFESLVIHDLEVFAQANNAEVLKFRNYDGLEVDAIVQLEDGNYLAIEIKNSILQVDKAANNLLKFKEKMMKAKDETKNSCEKFYNFVPKTLAIIVPTGQYSFKRSDGVFIIPFNMLKD
ncbi:ATP-binding protein [Mycoplasma miroungirhinis]|uniref:ATP-binding protein n=1 Tax=Mycoplasma miroungirhinis TaxID=754516 RepID=A0A6M4JDN1_9MOLU|nr:DUF4143 domain-containing protein [Mycoplasma miroungirhinis]QJR44176.1 ATP-binding protein [Mycoplasma miroungirhinis]